MTDDTILLPEGRYSFEVTKAQKKCSKGSGKFYTRLTCRVISPPFKDVVLYKFLGDPVAFPKAKWSWMEVLDDPYDPRAVGVKFDANVSHVVYQDVMRAQIGKLERYIP